MNLLIAPDSFKSSMSARTAAEAIYRGAGKVIPGLKTTIIPLSDGGEGFTECVVEGARGRYVEVNTHDALMRDIKAKIGLLDGDKVAVVELAAAAGIELLKKEELNPWITTTYGVGELISAALDQGCKKIILGLGGSATNDAGCGLCTALGIKFLDHEGNEIEAGGGELGKIEKIDVSSMDPRILNNEIVAACDVSNVLYGDQGASRVYGPQKGADEAMVQMLDKNLEHFSGILKDFSGKDVGIVAGSGAAGGTAASLLAFFGAGLVPGFEVVRSVTKLDTFIPNCDLVITGEGKIDSQTAFGKAPGSLAALAAEYTKPVVAFAGILGEGYEQLLKKGFSYIRSINENNLSSDEALRNGPRLLEDASEKFFREFGSGISFNI